MCLLGHTKLGVRETKNEKAAKILQRPVETQRISAARNRLEIPGLCARNVIPANRLAEGAGWSHHLWFLFL